MRVIAGTVGGIRLEVPKSGVRPTMDRVKAAIFSGLGNDIVGARILDLFAGTGAMGIEALSRGATSALFVENNRAAVAAIEGNLSKTKLSGQIRKQDVFSFLRQPDAGQQFDIIFADPPYERSKDGKAFTALLLSSPELAAMLLPSGTFVLEKRPSEPMPETNLWRTVRAKAYGATEVLFLGRSGTSVHPIGRADSN
jgi:16S rRNA (guanine966-N2)-methyltransferase